jgi:hypothetical protein
LTDNITATIRRALEASGAAVEDRPSKKGGSSLFASLDGNRYRITIAQDMRPLRSGRQPPPVELVDRARQLRAEGIGFASIARELGVHEQTVRMWFK